MPLFSADASALVKLVLDEPESEALRTFLTDASLVSSELVLAEVPRAIRRATAHDPGLAENADVLLDRAGHVLETVALAPVDSAVLLMAGSFNEPALRTLDAIHVATAADLAPLDGFLTYDERQAAVARLVGGRTFAPGA